ncbi:MAG TPA: response regulator transcription factor [Candidatus Paceibacterota bacterium]
MRLLVIDDDKNLLSYLKSTLESESFAVDTVADGKSGSYMARTNDYDLILLDNVLPGKSGYEVAADIRGQGNNVPILMLSMKTEVDEKVLHLDSGVDDYLTKPYSHKELVARVRNLIRRKNPTHAADTALKTGALVLNSSTQEVLCNKKEIYLTRKEFTLLELLLRNKGKVVSRGAIMEHVWDMAGDPFSKTIEMHVLNLRKKLEKGSRKYIYNIPGRGYKIIA